MHSPSTILRGMTLSGLVVLATAASVQDMDTIASGRISQIIGSISNSGNISSWLSTIDANGKWPDSEVNYTTGCDAQRANWPASVHWNRITTMAAAYHGGGTIDSKWVSSASLKSAISSAMDWWFARDYTVADCLYNGGAGKCPCGTPGLWNTNWFSNVILVPIYVGETCLIMNSTLTATQASNCSHTTTRAYSPFYDTPLQGFVSGANILDMSKIGIDQGVRIHNSTIVSEAYGRVHNQMVISPGIKVDGIKADGSFGQHTGLLYNGNYGTVFSNDVLTFEEAASGTSLAASDAAKNIFATLYDGNKWMIFYNTVTGVLHWDFSALPRFITFAVADNQPDANIMTNLTQVQHVGYQWGSIGAPLTNFASSLSGGFATANAGNLKGNRMFYANDYMVHRGKNYVSTLKMYSTRTKNTEYTNSQNPFGFHLADGLLYTYVHGSEYEDIAASWDWNKLPGITTDYGATPLQGSTAGQTGIQAFVGGTSDGVQGVAAMRYSNPITKGFNFQKVWFHLKDDVIHVVVNGVSSTSSAPIFSVLDQKRHYGDVKIATSPNGPLTTTTKNNTNPVYSLWHDQVGYTFNQSITASPVFFDIGPKTGSWQNIGTSIQPPSTVDLFSAWIRHINATTSVVYTSYPGVDDATFASKSSASKIRTIKNDIHVSAISDDLHNTSMIVFWDATGGSVQINSSVTVTSNGNAAVIYDQAASKMTVSDPSQTLSSVQITIASHGLNKTLTFALPPGPGNTAGTSVTKSV